MVEFIWLQQLHKCMMWFQSLTLVISLISLYQIISFWVVGHTGNLQSASLYSLEDNSSSSNLKLDICPPIISRAEWNARDPKAVAPMKLPVNVTIIHHSATGGCSTTVACIRLVKAIQNFHMDDRGWDDIGYSFLIGGDGNVYEGRGWNRTGAHAPKYNDKSIGICVIGNFMGKKRKLWFPAPRDNNLKPINLAVFDFNNISEHLPTNGQLAATKDLISCGISKNYIVSDYLLYGHRDVRATLCPGNVLYE